MYIHRKQFFLISFLLILSILACGPAGAATSTLDLNKMQTEAMQTIEALQPGGVTATTPPAQLEPTSELPSATVSPTFAAVTSTGTVRCEYADFVSETIPDGSDFSPGTTFTKTWRFRNTGSCTWNSSYAVVFDHGDALGAPMEVPFPGNVVPGQEVDLSINMTAPSTPGTYTSYWKLRNADGIIFLDEAFYTQIDVNGATLAAPGGIYINTPFIVTLVPMLPYTDQVLNQSDIMAGRDGSTTAACPSGSKVSGGGFALSNGLVAYTHMMDSNGWKVYANNSSGASQLLNAYAICLNNISGSTSQFYSQVTVAGGATGNAQVACPAGSVVTGGGYASNSSFTVKTSSMEGNGWGVYGKNNSGSNQLLNAYAICLSGSGGSTSQVYAQKSIAAGASEGVEVSCPTGTLLTGGGFASNTSQWVYNSSMKGLDSETWQVYSKNNSGSSQLLNSYAICLDLP